MFVSVKTVQHLNVLTVSALTLDSSNSDHISTRNSVSSVNLATETLTDSDVQPAEASEVQNSLGSFLTWIHRLWR